ncbi:MAG: hypothetical protein Kilf2KO_06240 [Rhodospirillales bacterium]
MENSPSNVLVVSSPDELSSALRNAQGGETIFLEGGRYGALDLDSKGGPAFNYSQPVTIRSLDTSDPASFSGGNLKGVANLTLDGVVIDYEAEPGAPLFETALTISDSSGVVIRNSVFDGDLAEGLGAIDDGFATGRGLVVKNSDDILVENNSFFEFLRGAVFDRVSDLQVLDNDIYAIRSDGLNFVQVQQVLVEGNHLHDFKAALDSDDHRDMIQFWTAGADAPSSDIVLRGNILDSGTGDPTQSIFMRNELVDKGLAGEEMFYRNILIEGNVIRNGHTNAIVVGEVDGLTIVQNTLVRNEATTESGSVTIPSIQVAEDSTAVTVAGNVAPRILASGNDAHTFENNLLVQSSSPAEQETYIGTLFVDGLGTSGDILEDLRALPGGPIEAEGLGSPLLLTPSTSERFLGNLEVEAGAGLEQSLVTFTVGPLIGPNGVVDPGAIQEVTWDFGDGGTASGLSVEHLYADTGRYEAEALVRLDDGSLLSLNKTLDVESGVVLAVDFEEDILGPAGADNGITASDAVTLGPGETGSGLYLNGGLVTFESDPSFFGNEAYSILVDFNAGLDGSTSGRLINFSDSFVIEVADGRIKATVTTDQGIERLQVGGLSFDDGAWHELALTFTGQDGRAILYLDQVEIGRIEGLEGAIQAGSTSQDFHLGHPWGTGFGGGIDNLQFLRGALSPEELAGRSSLAQPADPSLAQLDAAVFNPDEEASRAGKAEREGFSFTLPDDRGDWRESDSRTPAAKGRDFASDDAAARTGWATDGSRGDSDRFADHDQRTFLGDRATDSPFNDSDDQETGADWFA